MRNHQELKALYQRTKTQLYEILDERRNLKDVLAVFPEDSDKVNALTQTVVTRSHLDKTRYQICLQLRRRSRRKKRERQKAMKRADQTRDDILDPESENGSDTLIAEAGLIARKKSDNLQDDTVDAETECNSNIPSVVN